MGALNPRRLLTFMAIAFVVEMLLFFVLPIPSWLAVPSLPICCMSVGLAARSVNRR